MRFMMKYDPSMESVMDAVKYGATVCLCWPPRLDASKTNLILRDILWVIAFLFPAYAFVATLLTAPVIWGDSLKLTKIISELLAISVAILKMILCRFCRAQLQTGMEDLYGFVRMASKDEKEVLKRCLRKCLPMYASIVISAFCSGVAFCCAPLYISQPFPSDIEYPAAWMIDIPKIRAPIYIAEVAAITITCSAVFVDLEITMLLWYSCVQFEILGKDFEMATSSQKFDECIKKHQKLMKSVREVIIPARYVAAQLTATTVFGAPCCAYQLISNQPLAVKLRFLSLFCCTTMEVLMYAWPADNLMTTSGDIAWSAYCSPWTNEAAETPGKVLIVMLRAQKRLVIHVDGLPVLNLDFYGKFLTTSFSYLTTLRAVTG